MSGAATVIIADDHVITREGLRALLEDAAEFSVIAEASDGRTAIRLAEEHQPDLLVLDVTMPELGGLAAAEALRRVAPRTRIVALSGSDQPRVVRAMLDAGARGYVLKHGDFDELVTALRAVRRGHVYLSPAVAGGVLEQPVRAGVSTLSGREREVVQLVAEGRTSKEIADRLEVTVKTVEAHRKNIMDKLDIRTIAGLTKWAVREGLTSPD